MIETQVLIQEIQKKHQITLKPDDPVFVAVTLNDLLLSHYLEKFQALLEEQNKLVASEGIERLNQSSAMGSEMINRSLEATSQTMKDSTIYMANQIMDMLYERIPQSDQKLQKISPWISYIIIAFVAFLLGSVFRSVFFEFVRILLKF